VDGPPTFDGDSVGDVGRGDAAGTDGRRDATLRVLDAAVGVVGSTRHLLAVLEDVLREQRERVAAGTTPPSPREDGTSRTASGRQRIDLTY
jgi:hypothetical protein